MSTDPSTWQARGYPALCCGDFNTNAAQRECSIVPVLSKRRVLAALGAAHAAGLALYAVPDEMRALDELVLEFEWQLQAGRAFNGATWART